MFISYKIFEAFALKRNARLNFPFLKENGELLSIAANSNLLVEPNSIALYNSFYDRAYNLYKIYPQFARFILAIVTDLEALGQKGEVATLIAKDMVSVDILDFETADSRRLDTLALFTRLNITSPEIAEHERRVHQSVSGFTKNPDHFTYLNKPLFYELTHMVFFMTDYGRRPWPVETDIELCLKYAGVLAYLDDDYDLLAEICIAMRFISVKPPVFWEDAVQSLLSSIRITYDTDLKSALNKQVDEYHPYLMANWLRAIKGLAVFEEPIGIGTPNFSIPDGGKSDLARISNHAHKSILASNSVTSSQVTSLATDSLQQVKTLMDSKETQTITQNVLSCITGQNTERLTYA